MTSLEWQFGGVLRAWSPLAAWSLLAVVAVVGLGLVVWFYRRTLQQLPRHVRIILISLRAVLVLLLLLCLANPTRVERTAPGKARRKLAVLVDRSASMSRPDHRNMTRLADAVRIWKQHEAEAAEMFSTVTYQRFATDVQTAGDFNSAATAGAPGPETHLFTALHETLATDPAAVVCLTDGLDTTTNAAAALMAEAQMRGVPVYFVPGNNQSRMADRRFAIREIHAPTSVLRQSQFKASAVLEVVSPEAGDVPLELWSGDTKLAAERRPVRAGLNTLPWTVEVAAGEPGLMPLEFRLGTGAQQQVAAQTTHVVERTTVDMLYYQGALQWGYRFLRGALESDPSFRLTAILNPALGVQLVSGAADQTQLTDLPTDASELKRFQIVVLAHVFADQLSPRQQQALVEYARGGGGVLFIAPDTEASRRFSATALEQMLPVVFESPGAPTDTDTAGQQFQEKMQALGGSESSEESAFANNTIRRQTITPLTSFAPGPGGKDIKLFQAGPNAPQFSTYARVRAVKAGAEILAVHPTAVSPESKTPRVLVARQRFGNGFAAVMNTDLLWRWKLSMPSTNRAVEIFWQQFMLSLSPPPFAPSLQLVSKTEAPQTHHLVTVQVRGAAGNAPGMIAVSPQGLQQRLTLTDAKDEDPGVWQASFTPDANGRWEVDASTAAGDQARISMTVSDQTSTLEMLNLPPDTDGLQRLVEATGGEMIKDGTPVFRLVKASDGPPEIVRTRALWNTSWLVGLLLGVFCVELVVRRMFRLL